MVDRGGLNYKISVENKFSKNLTAFRDGVRNAKKEFDAFKKSLSAPAKTGNTAKSLKSQATALERLARAKAADSKATERRGKLNQAFDKVQERELRRTSKSRAAAAERIKTLRSETTAVKKLTTALRALAKARKAAGVGRAQKAVAAGQGVVPGKSKIPDRTKDFLGLNAAMKKTGLQGNKLSFTFRRLFGILAAFTIARQIASAFASAIKSMITFNQTIETSTLGIGSLLTAVGDVRDATGRSVEGVEGLSVAMGIAKNQVELLRKESLLTAATFEDLLETFQVAVAPGLTAGLDIDQVRQFTVQISQAATAIGLASNQLAEEIRSILSGTIQARTTRIAVALGITNEDIRRAKEAGVLAEFLQSRFSAFEVAAQDALGTFGAIFTNLQAGISQALGEGGLGFFDSLKTLLQEINDLIVQQDPLTGKLEINPGVVAAIKEIGDALKFVIDQVKAVGQGLGLGDLQNVAAGVGAVIKGVAAFASGFLEGLISGFSTLIQIVRKIVEEFTGVEGAELFSLENVREVGKTIGEILGFLGPILLAFQGLVALGARLILSLKNFRNIFKAPAKDASKLRVAFTAIVKRVSIVALAILGLGDALKELIEDAFGFSVQWRTIGNIVLTVVGGAFSTIFNFIKNGFGIITNTARIQFELMKTIIVTTARSIVSGLLRIVGVVSSRARKAAQRLERGTFEFNENQRKQITKLGSAIGEAVGELADAQDKINKGVIKGINSAIEKDADQPAETLAEAIENSIKEKLKGLFGEEELDLGLNDDVDAATDLLQVLKEMPGTVTAARQGLEGNKALMEAIRKETEQANNALEAQAATIGLTGTALKLQQEIVKQDQLLRSRTTTLTREQETAQTRLKKAVAESAEAQRKISEASAQDQRLVGFGLDGAKRLGKANKELADAKKEQGLQQEIFNKAIKTGEEGDIKRLELARELVAEKQRQLEFTEKEIAKINQFTRDNPSGGRFVSETTTGEDGVEEVRTEFKGPSDAQVEAEVAAINNLIAERLRTTNEEKAAQELIAQLERERLELLLVGNEAFTARVSLIARAQAEQNRGLIEQQQLSATIRNNLIAAGTNDVALRQAEAQNALLVRSAQLEEAALQRTRQTEAVERSINTLKERRKEITFAAIRREIDKETAVKAIKEIEQAITDLKKEQADLVIIDQNAENIGEEELARLQRDIDIAAEEGTGSMREVGLGFQQGFEEAEKRLPSIMKSIAGIVNGAMKSISDLGAKAFVSIFVGSEKSLKDQLADLLETLAQQIISTLIEIYILRNLLLPFLGEPASTSTARVVTTGRSDGGPIGRAEGGNIPEASHGYARPAGLHPTDTVPIWAAPKEYMIRASSAMKYGAGVMDSINRGLIDPFELKALAGGRRTRTSFGAPRGFQTGGEIIADAEASDPQTPTAPPSQAMVVANDENLDRLLSGGRNAFTRFMGDNAAAIRAELGIT